MPWIKRDVNNKKTYRRKKSSILLLFHVGVGVGVGVVVRSMVLVVLVVLVVKVVCAIAIIHLIGKKGILVIVIRGNILKNVKWNDINVL